VGGEGHSRLLDNQLLKLGNSELEFRHLFYVVTSTIMDTHYTSTVQSLEVGVVIPIIIRM